MKKILYILIVILTAISCSCKQETVSVERDITFIRPVALFVSPDGSKYSTENTYFNLSTDRNRVANPRKLVDVSYYFDSDDYQINKQITSEWSFYKGTLMNVKVYQRKNYEDGIFYYIEDEQGICLTIIRADKGLDRILKYEEAYSYDQFRDMVVVCMDREVNRILLE